MLLNDSTSFRCLTGLRAIGHPTRAFQRLTDELKERRAQQALCSCNLHILLRQLLLSEHDLNHFTVVQRLRP